jgi:hypothetical protein
VTETAARDQKFRQAAFVYLHVTILYDVAAYVMWRNDLLARNWGPPPAWIAAGLVVGLAITYGLLKWKHRVWLARGVWLIHGGRLPSLMTGAFLVSETRPLSPAFYQMAIVVVLINMWMLARAGWDL